MRLIPQPGTKLPAKPGLMGEALRRGDGGAMSGNSRWQHVNCWLPDIR